MSSMLYLDGEGVSCDGTPLFTDHGPAAIKAEINDPLEAGPNSFADENEARVAEIVARERARRNARRGNFVRRRNGVLR